MSGAADEFDDLVNMTPTQLEDFLETDESKEVGQKSSEGAESTGHTSGRRIVEIKRKKKADLALSDLKVGDRVVVVAGSPPNTVGSTNLMRVHEVGTDS